MAPDQRRIGYPDPAEASGRTQDRVVVGDLVLDLRGRDVLVGGRSVTLTRIEFDILAYLATHPGWVSSADQLMEDVWGYRSLGDARTVAVHMGNLRRKLGESKDEPRFIQTVRGAGYKLVDPATLENGAAGIAGTSGIAGTAGTVAAAPTPDATEPRAEAQLRDRGGSLIGREHEMAVLVDAWAEASRGLGGAVLVAGEAGTGKTRLVEELAVYAEAGGGTAAWGRCLEADGLPACWPWIQMLTHIAEGSTDAELRADTGPGAAELGLVIPEIRRRLPGHEEIEGTGSHADREMFYRAVIDYLMRASGRRPLLLVVDDLNLADPASLHALRALAPELAVSSVLLVAMYRESGIRPNRPLAETLDALARSRCRHLRVGGLGADDVERMVRVSTGRTIPAALARTIHEKTAGNPFFVVELARLLAAEGGLAEVDGGSAPTLILPREVRGVIERHIARLSPECRELLAIAALLGPSLDVLVLSGASGLSGEPLLDLLDEAIDARLLAREADSGRLRFVHPIVREVLAGERGEGERLRLHARIAETLEAHSIADPEGLLPDLAYHFARAAPLGYGPQAYDYSRRAGAGALRRFAYEEAADHFSRALTLLPCSGLDEPAQRRAAATLHEGIGDGLSLAARRDEAVQAYERAVSLAAVEERVARARLARKIGAAWLTDQEPARAERSFDAAEATLGAAPSSSAAEPERGTEWSREKLEITLQRMAAFYFRGDLDQLSSLLEGARPLAESAGTPQQQAVFATHYLALAFRRERYRVSPETVAYARDHWRRLHLSGDQNLACEAEFQLGFALLWAGETEDAHPHLTRCADLAEATRDHSHLVRALTYLSVVHRLRARVEEARAEAGRVVERATAAHLPGYVAAGKATLGWAYLRLGEDATAEEHAREALDLWRAPSAYPFEWLARWPLADMAVRRGRVAEAREHMASMLDPGQQTPPKGLGAAMEAAMTSDGTDHSGHLLAQAVREAAALNYC
ncbi:MAG: winged helix-turn-helix domain-containing protein [Thermoleophilia bacterium]